MTDRPADTQLVDLLGETRAGIVDLLRGDARSVAELAAGLGISEVAVRRHLGVLERDGVIEARTVRRAGPGRPAAQYRLTRKGRRLFPDQSAEIANELMTYLQEEHGRQAMLGFLRWRQGRHGERYAELLGGASSTEERADRLAALLTDDGFAAEATTVTAPDGATVLELRQTHCAVQDVAEEHPELCAYEAALFQQLLGARVSRRQTIAGGAAQCVCRITDPQTDKRATGAPHGHEG